MIIYSAQLPKEVEDAFHKKGYFLIVIGGGITGDLQVNDTSYHCPVKTTYMNLEMQLMLDLLRQDPQKNSFGIPRSNNGNVL